MRILIAAPASGKPEGGVANVVYNTAQALRDRGHEVTCLFREDVFPGSLPMPRLDSAYFSYRLARLLRRQRSEFDVAQIHAPAGLFYGLSRNMAGADRLPPYVMMLHGIEERRMQAMGVEARKGRAWHYRWKNRIWQRIYHMPLYRGAIQTADQCVVINWETWTMLQLKYGRTIDKVWYVPNGVEPQYFRPREYPGGEALRLLFVGGWLDHKGVYYLRDGFAALAQRLPGLRLTVAGCGLDAETVKGFFPPAARDRVDVLPFVPRQEMPAVYAAHDIFAFPSLFEGLPIVLLEAMASGMPVVTTETCGMKDVIEDGFNGLLVKPADAPAFAAALEKLARSPELRAQLGCAAQQTARRYTWARVAVQLEAIFALACKSN